MKTAFFLIFLSFIFSSQLSFSAGQPLSEKLVRRFDVILQGESLSEKHKAGFKKGALPRKVLLTLLKSSFFVEARHWELVPLLLDNSQKKEENQNFLEEALFVAIQKNFVRVVATLLESGQLKGTAKDGDGNNPMHLLLVQGKFGLDSMASAVTMANHIGTLDRLNRSLLHEKNGSGFPPLVAALLKGGRSREVIFALGVLPRAASVVDKGGRAPLAILKALKKKIKLRGLGLRSDEYESLKTALREASEAPQ